MPALAERLTYSHPEPKITPVPLSIEQIIRFAQAEGLTHEEKRLFLLPGTGFNVLQEVVHWENNLGKGTDNLWESTKRNILSYYKEFLDRRMVLDPELRLGFLNGQKRILDANGDLWLKDSYKNEREGVVTEAVGKVEEYMLQAPANTTAIIFSPPGWFGFPGLENFRLPEYQIYVHQKGEKDKYAALTIRMDGDITGLSKGEQIYQSLAGIDTSLITRLTEKERIKWILRNPIFAKDVTIEEIINEIGKVNGPIGIDDRPFNEIHIDMNFRKAKFEELDIHSQQHIKDFEEEFKTFFSQYQGESMEPIAQALGRTILQIHAAMKHSQSGKPEWEYQPPIYFQDFWREYEILKTYKGCVAIWMEETEQSYEFHKGDCVSCGAKDVEVGPCKLCRKCDKAASVKAA